MINNFKISIITVVYNGEKYLEKTILNVINQTYSSVEYIIIDGGSSDGTVDIIKKYEDKIDYWVSEKDDGIYDAMNKGIAIATGDWINFMNAGDVFYDENILAKIFNQSNFKDVDIIYGDVNHVCENYSYIKKSSSIKNIEYKMPFCHQSSFVSNKYHKKNKFRLDCEIIADYVLFYKAYKENKRFKQIDMVVAKFLRNGISSNYKIKASVDKFFFWKKIKVLDFKKVVFVILTIGKIFVEKIIPDFFWRYLHKAD